MMLIVEVIFGYSKGWGKQTAPLHIVEFTLHLCHVFFVHDQFQLLSLV